MSLSTVCQIISNQNNREYLTGLLRKIDDWDSFSDLIIKNGIAPFLLQIVRQNNLENLIPNNNIDLFDKAYRQTMVRNMLLSEMFYSVIALFQKHTIIAIPLKGISLIDTLYCNNIGLRHMSDIDVLLHPRDLENAGNILEAAGFKEYVIRKTDEIDHEKHACYTKNGILIELHQKIDDYFDSFSITTDQILKDAKSDAKGILRLSDEDMLIHVSIHFYFHVLFGKYSFSGFIDVFNLLQNKNIDWDRVIEKCDDYGCRKEFLSLLKLHRRFYEFYLPENIEKKLPTEIDPVIENNFKEYFYRRMENIIIVNKNILRLKNEHGWKNKCRQLLIDVFPNKSFMIYRYNPKFKWLYFIYYPIRFFTGLFNLFLFLFGKA